MNWHAMGRYVQTRQLVEEIAVFVTVAWQTIIMRHVI
jgi:hypothetical protein